MGPVGGPLLNSSYGGDLGQVTGWVLGEGCHAELAQKDGSGGEGAWRSSSLVAH